MTHTPLGYRIEGGTAVIHEAEAEMVRTIYREYLKGATLAECAGAAGFERHHSSVGRILQNSKYTGDGFYPPLIDRETFEKAAEERRRRAEKLGRIRDYPKKEKEKARHYTYSLGKVEKRYEDPFRQAEYVYSTVKTEVADDKNSDNDTGGKTGRKHSGGNGCVEDEGCGILQSQY